MTPPDPSTFIARGASAEVFALDAGHVLKLFYAGIDPGMVAREYAIACAIQQTDLPVARAVEQRDVEGRQGIVYTRIIGPTLFQHIRQAPHRAAWALRALAALQQMVHGRSVPALRSRKLILAEDIEASPISRRLREAALVRIDQLVEGDALSHGDLHPGNIIVTDRGLALIDWSKAARAAPAADVVRTEMLVRFGPGSAEGWLAAGLRDAAAAYHGHSYRRMTGLDREALVAWRALVALAWARHRLSSRDVAFFSYLRRALRAAGLPRFDG